MNSSVLAVRLLAPVLALSLAAPGTRGLFADEVDDLVKGEIQKRHVPGLSLAVLRDGQVIKVASYGLANVELNVPATPETVFQIQSITKTFTSAAILLLMEEGKLSLDDPIGKHLDGTPEAWKGITIRHLLAHTSGIKDFINEATASLRVEVTEEEVLQATASRPLNFAPGEKWSYSNTNYHLLAMVIRKLTGKWYGDFLKERIFDPLGMANTRVVSLSELIPNRSSGYHWRGNAFQNGDFVAQSILSYGGGGIASTASDLIKWAAAIEGGKLLMKATIDLAWTPARLNDGTDASYGLGWGTGSSNGHRDIGHSGGHITGFASQLSLFPDDRLAVVVLTNSGNANPGRIARKVAGFYVPALAPQPPRPIEDKEPQVTALLRDVVNRVGEWKLEPEKFTPDLWKAVSGQRVILQVMAKARGELKSLDLLSRTEAQGLRTYRYLTTFANGSSRITMTLGTDGKITGMFAEDE
jgi:CubicO group peptidase (beta-lactamase class C family)